MAWTRYQKNADELRYNERALTMNKNNIAEYKSYIYYELCACLYYKLANIMMISEPEKGRPNAEILPE